MYGVCVLQYDHIMKIIEVLGMPPKHMIAQVGKIFSTMFRLNLPTTQEQRRQNCKLKLLTLAK
jgi:hypothetical protein